MAGGAGRGVSHPLPPTPPARQHCWVKGVPGARGPHPGLVLEWRRAGDGAWEALVVFVVESQQAAVQQWLPPSSLTPVGRSTRA